MTSVLLVDWLGRGGIAQTSEAWAIELGAAGREVTVVTRPGRELGSGSVPTMEAPDARGRIASHRAVVRTAAAEIRASRPDVVVVQNYVVPPLERPVYEAARVVGARLVVVVHNHRHHSMWAGSQAGLARRLREADVVVTHSGYVADGVRKLARRPDVTIVPLPAQVGMLRHPRETALLPTGPEYWAGHFGVLHRRYKGGALVKQLARRAVTGWGFVAVGPGAPAAVPGLEAVTGYVAPGTLVGMVAATDVTLAPYRGATQSAAIVLAHLLGSVPVASAVGGIPEQIEHEVDGLLVPPGASVDAWCDALLVLSDDDARKEMALAGTARAWREHEAFISGIAVVVA